MTSKGIILGGGCALAFGASFANVALVLETGTSVSHLTGDISTLTVNVAKWSPGILPEVFRVLAAALCFLLGATLSGVLIHHPVLDVSRPYGRSLIGIGVFFILASLVIGRHPVVGIGLAGFGCGFQNALASHYRSLVLRTTHLTGMFTDLGILAGMRLRGHEIPLWKMVVPALLICSFFVGGVVAAVSHFTGYAAILLAGIGYVVAGVVWSVLKRVMDLKSA